jgi:hypothetical protein
VDSQIRPELLAGAGARGSSPILTSTRQRPARRVGAHALGRDPIHGDGAGLGRAVALPERHAEALEEAAGNLGRDTAAGHAYRRRRVRTRQARASQHVGHHRRASPVPILAGCEQAQEAVVLEVLEERKRRAQHGGGHQAMVEPERARDR